MKSKKLNDLKNLLNNSISIISKKYTPELFTTTHSANLAMALFLLAEKKLCTKNIELGVIYKLERRKDDNSEKSRVLSHVFVSVDLNSLDINGWNACDRWCDYIFDDIKPSSHTLYNDVEYLTLKGDEILDVLPGLCKQYNVPFDFNFIRNLVCLIEGNNQPVKKLVSLKSNLINYNTLVANGNQQLESVVYL